MNNFDKKIFSLYPSCVLVNGKNKDALYDLQRQSYSLIPHALYYILTKYNKQTIGSIKEKYADEANIISEYFKFMLDKDYGVLCEKNVEVMFRPLPHHVFSPKLITNAIFDYDKNESYNLMEGIRQLSLLKCENLELRFYDYISLSRLTDVLKWADDTTLRDIEIMLQYGEDYTFKNILNIRLLYPRLRKVSIVNSPKNLECIYSHEEIFIIYTSQEINDESHCGICSPWYYLPKIELYMESLSFNNCLNAKISTDRFGNIKNCPSMAKSWGKFGVYTLSEVANNKEFQKIWFIKKDDIDKCKECELRYMCQDCRAYIKDKENIYSAPTKCNYVL